MRDLSAPDSASFFATPDLLRMTNALVARIGRGALATRAPTGSAHGSIVRVGIAGDGAPFFTVRAHDEHVRHLGRDARASVLVVDPCSDQASRFRVTLTGTAVPLRRLPPRPRGAACAPELGYVLRVERLYVAGPELGVWFRVRESAVA